MSCDTAAARQPGNRVTLAPLWPDARNDQAACACLIAGCAPSELRTVFDQALAVTVIAAALACFLPRGYLPIRRGGAAGRVIEADTACGAPGARLTLATFIS